MNNETILLTDDLKRSSKMIKNISLQVDNVTCIECCKYYIAPTTATICGHTLCRTCWYGRKNCPVCGSKTDRKNLKLNLVLQNLTEHTHNLADALEDLFNFKLDDCLPYPEEYLLSEKDPNKNINEWLASSQNHFSAPVSSQYSTPEMNEPQKLIVSDIQIHTKSNKNTIPAKAIYIPTEQIDWDKIEELPDSEDILNKDKENIVGPMDIETYNYIPNEDLEYSTENPRRSSRKKDTKEPDSAKSSKLSTSNKNNKNWTNVKKMRKEFSKLNTKNKNKLNVSIEMCKKVNSSNNITPQNVKNSSCNSNEDSGNTIFKNEKRKEGNFLVNHPKDIVSQIERRTKEHESDKSRNIEIINCAAIHSTESQKDISKKPNVCFFKKSVLIGKEFTNTTCINDCFDVKSETHDIETDDIEIRIKIGSTITNIYINKKENDVQFKINSDKETQTSVDNKNSGNQISVSTSPIKEMSQKYTNPIDKSVKVNSIKPNINEGNIIVSQKASDETKKNTESADTSTITESIQRELSTVMENMQTEKRSPALLKMNNKVNENNNKDNIHEDFELNDLDIFCSESVKEANVQSLKESGQAPSVILLSTNLSKTRTQKNMSKRYRDASEVDNPCSKKSKSTQAKSSRKKQPTQKSHNDSELVNYDDIMSQVFANIDADINYMHKSKDTANTKNLFQTQENDSPANIKCSLVEPALQSQNKNKSQGMKMPATQKYSENIFSSIEKYNEDMEFKKSDQSKTTTVIDSSKTNAKSILDNPKHLSQLQNDNVEVVEFSTPQCDYDSDKSVVEETPQKNTSITRNKHTDGVKIDVIANKEQVLKVNHAVRGNNDNKMDESQGVINIASISNSVSNYTRSSRNVTVVELSKPKETESPISIDKFANDIMYKSTPVARKALHFSNNNSNEVDFDQTLCSSAFVAAKNTQEMEIMSKAFEQDNLMSQNVMDGKSLNLNRKYYLAGSCLSSFEKANVQQLCALRNWAFTDNYTKELTHLIIGVDEEKKAKRSAKFMCALAASKWIVAYEWVDRCLQMKHVVDEEPYEVLDVTGEPGPKRSRLAKQKLFNGIKFFCMPPFAVLDMGTLKEILLSAGGTVVNQARAVRVTESPALLLAEPESTQEDKFIYLAMELSIVPVNYEWVLNCLGSYTLCSIHELLLCPSSLLPSLTSKWPSALISTENDSLIDE